MTSECVEWLSKTFALWGCPESTFPSFWCQCLDFRLDTFFSCPCSPCISEWSEPSASSDVFPDWLKLIFIFYPPISPKDRSEVWGPWRTMMPWASESTVFSCFTCSVFLLARVPFHHILEGMLYFPAVYQQQSMGTPETAGSHLAATRRTRRRMQLT